MKIYAEETVAPVMFCYVEWILKKAEDLKIKRLYFLARDGYMLQKIATVLVKNRKMDIDCRYLYCSRQALRIPSYHIIGEEAFELLTLGGYHLTPRSVILRAALGRDEEDRILEQLGIKEPDTPLTDSAFSDFKKRLKDNRLYRSLVIKKSISAYSDTLEYFRQEGIP